MRAAGGERGVEEETRVFLELAEVLRSACHADRLGTIELEPMFLYRLVFNSSSEDDGVYICLHVTIKGTRELEL